MLIEAFAIWPNEGQAKLAIAGSNLTGVDTDSTHNAGVTLALSESRVAGGLSDRSAYKESVAAAQGTGLVNYR